jgi:predicted glycosyltransferase
VTAGRVPVIVHVSTPGTDQAIELARHAEQVGADCVVAMAGYNTVCDILSFQRRAVLTPRSGPSQEQRLRAARLEQWGVAHLLSEGRDGDRLAAAITSAMAATPATAPVPLGGIQAALDVFDATTARQAAA